MSAFNCPKCGVTLKVIPLSSSGQSTSGSWQRGQSFPMGAAPPGGEYSRETPTANMNTIEAGVKLPFLQSLLVALIALLLAILAALHWGWHWTSPIVAAVIAFCLALWFTLTDSRRLLRSVETVIGRDLDGDGRVGPEFTVELTEPLAGRADRMIFAHFKGISPIHLVKFAQAALDDRLTPAGAGLSRKKFNRVRSTCLERKLIYWRNPEHHAQGLGVSRGGQAAFQQMIDEICEA